MMRGGRQASRILLAKRQRYMRDPKRPAAALSDVTSEESARLQQSQVVRSTLLRQRRVAALKLVTLSCLRRALLPRYADSLQAPRTRCTSPLLATELKTASARARSAALAFAPTA